MTVPVGNQLMYVEPVYAQISGGAAAYPILQFVLVYYGGQVGVGNTLSEALQGAIDAGGGSSTGPSATPSTGTSATPSSSPSPSLSAPSGTAQQQVKGLLADAQQHFQKADEALTAGDLATYASEIKAAQQDVNQALSLSGQGASSSPSTAASPSAGASAGASSSASSSGASSSASGG